MLALAVTTVLAGAPMISARQPFGIFSAAAGALRFSAGVREAPQS